MLIIIYIQLFDITILLVIHICT